MRAEMRWVTAAFVLGGVIACRLSAGAADVGKLYVKSKPGRASVYLDQETDSRGNTPCYIRGVPVGEHTVRVHLSGYADVSEVVDVAAGDSHTLALKADGTVWACGLNNYGQVGDGTHENRSTFVKVAGLADVVAIAAGYYHSAALLRDGSLWVWGNNSQGQLGEISLAR